MKLFKREIWMNQYEYELWTLVNNNEFIYLIIYMRISDIIFDITVLSLLAC